MYFNINQLDALNFIMCFFQASTCFEHTCSSSEAKIVLYNLWYHHTETSERSKITKITKITKIILVILVILVILDQFWPPDDEHVSSKHVEAWNKLIIKLSASSWLILR